MSPQPNIHTHLRRIAALGLACLAPLAIACDDEPIADVPLSKERAALAAAGALVSDSPDIIDGFSPVGFDEERQIYVYDRDDDGFPDITEALDGTDMLDPDDNLAINSRSQAPQAAVFPATSCRSGFIQAGPRLCITQLVQNATRYRFAVDNCRNKRSDVCSYEDLTYLYLNSGLDASYNPDGAWIGNMVDDDLVLCGNRSITFNGDPDLANFEGTCSKHESREYWCCHGDE
ncbi:hypothetical protein [Enhygromyxa salina]|uniref:Uncharacterized protein n=1 Tax=Enhygromyxa salina TaxID=215803 RepID=A0A2S9XQY7_9BACT|nr:hypothetical protein [Enhygromyxa salina]PRP95150.1 hypothetical protein ENSA7_74640 [Enhygromyxa salina]